MKQKLKVFFISLPVSIISIVIILYILLAVYYRDGFSYGTWINGVYCTGKGIEEINLELKTKYETGRVEVIAEDEPTEYIYPADIDYSIDFTNYLKYVLEKQNSFLWGLNLFEKELKTSVLPDVEYDEDKLSEKVSSLKYVVDNRFTSDDFTVEIRKGDNGYYLFDDYHKSVDEKKVFTSIKKALSSNMTVTLDSSFLNEIQYKEEQLKTISEWNNLSEFFEPKIVLDMGDEKINIDGSVLSDFLVISTKGNFIKEDNGSYKISEEAVYSYVDNLLDNYDTFKSPRKYKTVHGDEKEIDLVMYGTLIDHEDMKQFLYEGIKSGIKETYEPKYIRTAYHRGLDDIGPTYIEIDMGEQVLYFFKDGKLDLKTDIVTGKPSTPTPAMVTKVCSMSRDVILRGDNYASPVKYWVPIYPSMGIGLHDASWQSAFGGERWKTHGSHGCVNMIKDDVAYLYEQIEVGIPVILYY